MTGPAIARRSEQLSASPIPGAVTVPWAPRTLEETDLPGDFLLDLILKLLNARGSLTGSALATELGLAYPIVDDLVMHLRDHQWVEVRSADGGGPMGYRLALSRAGRDRALQALEHSGYVGPAPVSMAQLRDRVAEQSIHRIRVPRSRVRKALRDLILAEEALEALGPAVNSGRSFFLYGAPGNGKTAVASRLSAILGEPVFIPHAVMVDGHVITIFDPAQHRPAPLPEEGDATTNGVTLYDQRWVRAHRPTIVTSGELQLRDLDLRFDPVSRVYRAPVQLKAMSGALVLDDFGRQRATPSEILSRWILPLEYEIDYLSLHTGFKFQIPFDCLLIFASNLDPDELVDEAFLRRIQYKIHLGDPTPDQYREIFSREASRMGIGDTEGAVEWIFDACYGETGISPRACHPRDLLKLVSDLARYQDREPVLDDESLRFARDNYFLSDGSVRAGGIS